MPDHRQRFGECACNPSGFDDVMSAVSPGRSGARDNTEASPALPKVSVAMITYNHEKFIGKAIESVLTQEIGVGIELVVGEDCSVDSTRSIVQTYAARFPGVIRVVTSNENVGVMRNFVRTIEACRGDYIAFLEGDDYWTNRDKLRLQTAFLDEHPDCALCHHRVSYLDDATGQIVSEFPPPQHRMRRTAGSELANGNFIQTCSLMIRRKAIPRLSKNFAKLKLGDWPLCALTSQNGWIGYIDQNMGVYRLHQESAWFAQNIDYRDAATREMVRFMALSLSREYRRPWVACFLWNLRSDLSLNSRSGKIRSTAGAGAALLRYGVRLDPVRAPRLLYYATRLLGGAVKRRLLMLWHDFRHDDASTATHPE
jgi:glycosyltransferase involved in cell wall biosynthesis